MTSYCPVCVLEHHQHLPHSVCDSQVVLGFVSEKDYNLVAKAIRHYVTEIKHQREKRHCLAEETLNYQKEALVKTSDNASPSPDTKVCSGTQGQLRRTEAGGRHSQFLGRDIST